MLPAGAPGAGGGPGGRDSEPVKKSPKLNLGTVLEFNFGDFFTGSQNTLCPEKGVQGPTVPSRSFDAEIGL